jgi:tetratricopeptide (TPR) repeat protein
MDTDRLEAMLARGEDTALLRFTLGTAFYRKKQYARAAEHLKRAVEVDPGYSAAWRNYGKALADGGETAQAIEVFRKGIEVARGKGDMQALREMEVFLRRLLK